ncbi:cold-shock protein [Metarhizobium album]|uniref:Cold-shock protein n=1 Tax=Metarhizobium album TaxID=2182425 RepID=A0A2U2DG23_9HYPH|nr:cold shock domain-containing protein [Rhizobium album]PWE52224.1 cold-shock protein [Rhizobium album]
MHTGTVKWYSHEKRFGFITADSGGDVFVHENTLKAAQLDTLLIGQKVSFTADLKTPKPRANSIMVTANPERRKSVEEFEEEWGLRKS